VASEIDFTNDPPAQPIRIIGSDDLADELVSGDARKPGITAQQLQIRVANATAQKTNEGKSVWTIGSTNFSNLDAPISELDSNHFRPLHAILKIAHDGQLV
jgi:hypothetical protein